MMVVSRISVVERSLLQLMKLNGFFLNIVFDLTEVFILQIIMKMNMLKRVSYPRLKPWASCFTDHFPKKCTKITTHPLDRDGLHRLFN